MDYRGIGLLELIHNVVETITDTRLRASVRLHNVLHDLHAGRVMGMAILEPNLAQELVSMY